MILVEQNDGINRLLIYHKIDKKRKEKKLWNFDRMNQIIEKQIKQKFKMVIIYFKKSFSLTHRIIFGHRERERERERNEVSLSVVLF